MAMAKQSQEKEETKDSNNSNNKSCSHLNKSSMLPFDSQVIEKKLVALQQNLASLPTHFSRPKSKSNYIMSTQMQDIGVKAGNDDNNTEEEPALATSVSQVFLSPSLKQKITNKKNEKSERAVPTQSSFTFSQSSKTTEKKEEQKEVAPVAQVPEPQTSSKSAGR